MFNPIKAMGRNWPTVIQRDATNLARTYAEIAHYAGLIETVRAEDREGASELQFDRIRTAAHQILINIDRLENLPEAVRKDLYDEPVVGSQYTIEELRMKAESLMSMR